MRYIVHLFIIIIPLICFHSYANYEGSDSLPIKIITKENYNSLLPSLEDTNKNGGLIILSSDLPKEPLPILPNTNTRILDFRYNNGIHFIKLIQ